MQIEPYSSNCEGFSLDEFGLSIVFHCVAKIRTFKVAR